MKISELSRRTGTPVSTIKFYMSQGLLPEPKKKRPNVAYYDKEFLERLKTVKRMRDDGLSVKTIREILEKHPFERVEEWDSFRRQALKKRHFELSEGERLATLTGAERKREEILSAAFRVFSTKGFHNTTVEDIAQEACVSKGTCYQYFHGKEDIFEATIDRTLEKLLSEAESSAAQASDPLERLGLKGLTFISNYRDLQMMFIGLFTEILGGNERMKRKAAQVHEKVASFLMSEIDRGIRVGKLRKVDSESVAYALIGIAEAAGSRNLFDEEFDALKFFITLMDFIEKGLAVRPSEPGKAKTESPKRKI